MSLAIFGVRHHGPGSARAVVRALEAFEPDTVLVEGPPEASDIISLARDPAMEPPVAILAYAVDQPRRALFYPFATFSPEWQAMQYALQRELPVRFIDLPIANVFASRRAEGGVEESKLDAGKPAEDTDGGGRVGRTGGGSDTEWPAVRVDPLDEIAVHAGLGDGERFFDAMIERRASGDDVFEALEALMGEARMRRLPGDDVEEIRREAAMRQAIRAARKQFGKVAVVCGAWHAPALREDVPAIADTRVLRDLPKTKVAATWIPWTHGRLALESGYGAGIESPGWYEHLWGTPSADIVSAWMAKAARALRGAGLDIASAHAIEAARLAESLAALRESSRPSLADLTDAIGTIYCFGDTTPLALLREKLIVGERLGVVPENGTRVPLLADLAREQKRLRLAPDPAANTLELDLRKANDLDRSRLWHRLQMLGIPWGRLAGGRASTGTFRERWGVRWVPEFAVTLIERSAYGNTIVAAAEEFVRERAAASANLAEVTGLLHATLRADLAAATDAVLARVNDLAAQTHDVAILMDAVPDLVQIGRYGDVRQTDSASVAAVLEHTIVRACIGLLSASLALDDAAANAMYDRTVAVDGAVRLLDRERERSAWNGALLQLAGEERVHGLIAGRATRALLDASVLEPEAFSDRLTRALGRAVEPAQAAAWIEGAFRKSGLVIVHQPALLDALDTWLGTLDADTFVATLPLVRRTFGTFAAPERSAIGTRIAATGGGGAAGAVAARGGETPLDWERARTLLPSLREILGVAGGVP